MFLLHRDGAIDCQLIVHIEKGVPNKDKEEEKEEEEEEEEEMLS